MTAMVVAHHDPVAAGEHQYKWVVDGEWRIDLDNPSV